MPGRCCDRIYGGVVHVQGTPLKAVPRDADPNPIPSTVRADPPSADAIPITIVYVDRGQTQVEIPDTIIVDVEEF